MKKMTKGFVAGLIAVAIVIMPACRSTKKKTPTQPTTTTVATDTGSIPMTATVEPPPVQQPRDFVQEDPRPVEEIPPSDIEQLNRWVQQRGLVRDAFFNYDAATLDGDAQAALTASATWVRANPGYNLLIEGHCDERGTEQYNLALGDRRANSAKEFLMTLGIDGSRIRTVSYGEERPFEEGHDEASFAQNRRAHLVLVSGR